MHSEEKLEYLRKGLEYFRAREFYLAHEAWEDAWREMQGKERNFWKCMIQLAVGAYHFQQGNAHGTKSMWQKALARTDEAFESSVAQELRQLHNLLKDCLDCFQGGQDPLASIQDFADTTLNENWLAFSGE